MYNRLFSFSDFCGPPEYNVTQSLTVSLSSPNYPDIYWNDLNCYWHIRAPDNGTLLMTLADFDTEEHYDYMTVWEGNNITHNAVVLRLSGQRHPDSLSVASSEMWVRFQSDKGYGTRGFLLQFDWSPENGKYASERGWLPLLSRMHTISAPLHAKWGLQLIFSLTKSLVDSS